MDTIEIRILDGDQILRFITLYAAAKQLLENCFDSMDNGSSDWLRGMDDVSEAVRAITVYDGELIRGAVDSIRLPLRTNGTASISSNSAS